MSRPPHPTVTGTVADSAARLPPYRPDRRRFGLGAVFLIAVCVAAYANSLPNPFHRDDVLILQQDPRVGAFQVRELLTGNYWYIGDTDRLYRPVVLLSYALNWAISHQPWTFRAPNLAMHAGVCVVLLGLVWRIYGSYRIALISASFFALHALHTEPLNTIVGRADLLVTLFMLGAAVLYWDDATPDSGRRWLPPVAGALLAAGLLCKENAVTFPALVALLDWWRVRRGDVSDLRAFLARRAVRCYLPVLLLVAGYLLLRWNLFGMLAAGTDSIHAYDNPIAHTDLG
ncbi:MAG: hypothetical protein ACYSUI_09460, partial [Planctomycetota bacterium]